jgi:translocation and assembly module TamB
MRRSLKITAWTLGSLLALVAIVVLMALIVGNTESGRALIVRTTSRLTDGHVQLSGITGSFPAALDLDRLQLSDDQGVWLVAQHISLRWSPLALLARHIEVDTLHVGRLHIERAPISKSENKPSSGFSFPRSDLRHLSVDTLELGAPLAGTPTSLVVNGSAHWQSMRDALASITAQRSGGIGNYNVQLRFDDDRMDATLELQEPAHGPLENLLQVPGLGDLSVLARLSGPRAAEKLQLSLDAGALHARANGTLNLTEIAADLDYAVTAAAMTPRPGLAWQSIDLQGRWHGAASAPAADGHLLVKQLQIPGGTRLDELNANLTAKGGLLSARATLTGLVIPGPQPEIFQDAPLTLGASMHLDDSKRPVELNATHKLFSLQAHATTTGVQSAQLDLRLLDVAPFAALGGQQVSGTAAVKAQVRRDTQSAHLTADINANIDGGTAAWAGLFRGSDTRLQLAGALSDEKITIDRLQLNSNAMTLGASGSMARSQTQDLSLRVSLSLSDLAKLSPAAQGTLRLSGNINGPRDALSAAADVSSTLSVHGSPTGTLSASVRADGLLKAPRGTVEAHGDLDGAPLQLDVSLERGNGDVVHAIVRHAYWKSAHIEGDLTSGAEIALARGNLKLRMDQLGDLNRLLGTTLQGSVDGSVTLTPTPAASSRAQIDLEAHNVVTGGVTTNAKLAANGTMDALNVQLDAQSPAIGGEPASITSTAILDATGREVHLTGLEAKYHGQAAKLLAPATVSFADGLDVRELKLGAQEAVLEVDGRLSTPLDVRVSLQRLEPDLINAFVPKLLASGTVGANARIQGSPAAPSGSLHLEALGMRSADNAALGLPASDLRADAQLMGNTALLDTTLDAGRASHLALQGHVPLASDGALDLKLAGKMDVGLFNPLTEASGKHVTGQLNIDTTLTGSAATPEIGGTVRLNNGSVRDYTQGINLTDITGEFTGSRGTLQIQSLTARAAPGNVSLTGTIGILQPQIPVDIKLIAKNAQPISSNIITANVDMDMSLSGTAREKLDVNGKVRVNRANIEVPSSFPPNVAVLDVRRPGEAPPPQPEKPLIIALNITVDAPRQILVKGRGLDAELGGEIRVRGTAETPVVGGSFDLQRGTFTLGSSPLTFTQGTVTFNGEGLKKKIDPTLDFIAQTQVADVTATIKITGLADQPKIELSSSPDLPQDEIMARLLFGESASQLTALQVVQIGAALAQLTGGGTGLNPLAKIQKTLGLDRLTVGSDPGTGTTPSQQQQNTGYNVEAGRYVSPRVFVSVKESTTLGSQLAVDVDLTRHLKLQTRLGNGSGTNQGTTPENDRGSSVGLAYQFEY